MKGVVNNIVVKPTVRPHAIKDEIEKALLRNAEIDSENVNGGGGGGRSDAVRQRPLVAREVPGRVGRLERPGVDNVRNDINVVAIVTVEVDSV